jgi:hypothetical protein
MSIIDVEVHMLSFVGFLFLLVLGAAGYVFYRKANPVVKPPAGPTGATGASK